MYPFTPGWREAIIVKCLAQGHLSVTTGIRNPHSAEQKHQSLSSVLFICSATTPYKIEPKILWNFEKLCNLCLRRCSYCAIRRKKIVLLCKVPQWLLKHGPNYIEPPLKQKWAGYQSQIEHVIWLVQAGNLILVSIILLCLQAKSFCG